MQMHLIAEMREVGETIKGLDEELREVEAKLEILTSFYSEYST